MNTVTVDPLRLGTTSQLCPPMRGKPSRSELHQVIDDDAGWGHREAGRRVGAVLPAVLRTADCAVLPTVTVALIGRRVALDPRPAGLHARHHEHGEITWLCARNLSRAGIKGRSSSDSGVRSDGTSPAVDRWLGSLTGAAASSRMAASGGEAATAGASGVAGGAGLALPFWEGVGQLQDLGARARAAHRSSCRPPSSPTFAAAGDTWPPCVGWGGVGMLAPVKADGCAEQ